MEISWDFFFFFFFSRAGRRRFGTQCLKIKQQRQRDRDRRGAQQPKQEGTRERVARGVDEQAIMSLAFDEYGRPFIVIKVSFAFPRRGPRPPPRTQTFGPIWLKGAKIGHTGAGRGGPLEDSGTHERSGRTDRHCDGSSFLFSLSLSSPLFPANPKQTHTLNTT